MRVRGPPHCFHTHPAAVYNDGDDAMKRTIGEAWTKSRAGGGAGGGLGGLGGGLGADADF